MRFKFGCGEPLLRIAHSADINVACWRYVVIGNRSLRTALGGVALACVLPSCASHGVKSGMAVAKVGQSMSMHAESVPQGAQACALGEALSAPSPGGTEKPVSETCSKALNSDLLWRRAMIVLSAYSVRLEELSSGGSPETAGHLEATMTGVQGDDW